MTPKEALQKLQSQPDSKKKIIVWGLTFLLGIGLFAWWFGSIQNTIGRNEGPNIGEQLRLNELQERLNDIPAKINGEQ
jgi:hypothetical protein